MATLAVLYELRPFLNEAYFRELLLCFQGYCVLGLLNTLLVMHAQEKNKTTKLNLSQRKLES
jgi:hypothetical protein